MSMVTPTDRGFVFIRKVDDGTAKVIVCTSVANGEPVAPFAVHQRYEALDIAPEVVLTDVGGNLHSTEVLQVYADKDGVVHVSAPPATGQSILEQESR